MRGRDRLLAPNEHGATIFQQLIRQLGSGSDKPEGFGIDQLVGGHRDGDVTVLGQLLESEPIKWKPE